MLLARASALVGPLPVLSALAVITPSISPPPDKIVALVVLPAPRPDARATAWVGSSGVPWPTTLRAMAVALPPLLRRRPMPAWSSESGLSCRATARDVAPVVNGSAMSHTKA